MKKIFPKKVVLSRDECVRVGNHVIGYWESDYIAGSSHFRPSSSEGRLYYKASLNNGENVDAFTQAELREEIIAACKDGIEPSEYSF